MAIDTLTVAAVRGIRHEVPLPLDAKSLVMRGDNGTGKSSFVYALLWALRGDQLPAEKASEAGECWAHILDPNAARVVVTLKGGGRIEITPKGVSGNDAGKAFRAACQKANPFLLRKQLLRFLEDRPADRFQYLESFLDLEQADATQNALVLRAKRRENDADEQQHQLENRLAQVRRFLPNDLQSKLSSWSTLVSTLLEWATRAGVTPVPATWQELLSAMVEVKPLLVGEFAARRRVALDAAVAKLGAFEEVSEPICPTPLLERLDALEARATDADCLQLLEESAAHLTRHPTTARCPVCERDVDPGSLASRLKARLDGLRELKEVRAQLEANDHQWLQYCAKLSEVLAECGNVSNDAAVVELIAQPNQQLRTALWSQATSARTRAQAIAGADARETIDGWQVAVRAALERLTTERNLLPDEANIEPLRDVVRAVKDAEKIELAVSLAASSLSEARQSARDLKALAEALRKARQDVAKELLGEISELVKTFYAAIHPEKHADEVTGAPRIEVQRHSKGSAHVRGEFNRKEIDDPRLLYSDGHLDTVGICVFLALRRFRAQRDRENDPRLLVLDDVVLSIDLGHGRRLLDLLREQFSDHQVLIFTHNGLFFDWCGDRLPTYAKKVIRRWSLETGPQLGDFPSALERLARAANDESSPKILAQSVMNLMDEWLADARIAYSLSVPAKRGEEYTLTEIWQPFCKRMKQPSTWVDAPNLSDTLTALKDVYQMRNRLAAHDNEFALEFPLGTVREYALNCIRLVQTLFCAGCRGFALAIPRPEDPQMFCCKCEKLRYIRPAKSISALAAGEP